MYLKYNSLSISLIYIQNKFGYYYKAIVNNMTYSELQKPWYSEDRLNDYLKIIYVALLFCKISVIDEKMGK